MPINLTRVYERVNNVKRNLFYDKTTTARFYLGNKLLFETSNGFYVRKTASTNLALGIEFFEASISIADDTVDLEKIIPVCNAITFGSNKYALTQYFRPRDATKKWNLRLESWSKKHETGG